MIGAIRPCRDEDIPALCELLNEIIAIGGKTVLETRFTVSGFIDHFFNQQIQISCLVAEDAEGAILGFQVLSFHEQLPDDWAEIATFVSTAPGGADVGSALFAETVAAADRYGINTLNAALRADNVGGIAYYEKMGFSSWKIDKGVPLKSGRPVDRIFLRYTVRRAEQAPDI